MQADLNTFKAIRHNAGCSWCWREAIYIGINIGIGIRFVSKAAVACLLPAACCLHVDIEQLIGFVSKAAVACLLPAACI